MLQRARQQIGRWMVFSALLAAIVAFFYFDLAPWLTLEQLKIRRDTLQSAVHAYGAWAVMVYILLYILQTALSLPGATIFTLAGGFLFGSLWGTLYTNIGATLGATLAFLSARYLFRTTAEKKLGAWFHTICRGVEQHPFSYLLTLRLTAIFPFFLINFAFGLTPMRILPYMLATSLGILPVSFVIAHAGRQLGTLNSVDEILSPKIFGIFILFGALALVPMLYKKFRPVQGGNDHPEPTTELPTKSS